mgnify:CR=1 FL=1
MLPYSNNRQYNRIFHDTENKNKLIQHFKLVLDRLVDRFNIPDNIKSILNNQFFLFILVHLLLHLLLIC